MSQPYAALLNAPILMAFGALLLVFGILFALLSGTIIDNFYSYNFYGNYQVAIGYSELVGLVLASIGAGFLAYGYGLNSEKPSQSQPSA